MQALFGHSRDVTKERYALRTPEGFIPSWLPGWTNCEAMIHISPEMGARFSQWQITFQQGGAGNGDTGSTEYIGYLLSGKCAAEFNGKKTQLTAGNYFYLPPRTGFGFGKASVGTRLLVFEKHYVALAGYDVPKVLIGHERNIKGQPFMGNKDALLQVLFPTDPNFDMAVNIFTYQSGATLPLVETHIMEHGLMMLSGQGIYRLNEDWHPVRSGDVIWMASYCPQWFVAMGGTSASYIYYKDVNRPSLTYLR